MNIITYIHQFTIYHQSSLYVQESGNSMTTVTSMFTDLIVVQVRKLN